MKISKKSKGIKDSEIMIHLRCKVRNEINLDFDFGNMAGMGGMGGMPGMPGMGGIPGMGGHDHEHGPGCSHDE
jgi:hypothetical protein